MVNAPCDVVPRSFMRDNTRKERMSMLLLFVLGTAVTMFGWSGEAHREQ